MSYARTIGNFVQFYEKRRLTTRLLPDIKILVSTAIDRFPYVEVYLSSINNFRFTRVQKMRDADHLCDIRKVTIKQGGMEFIMATEEETETVKSGHYLTGYQQSYQDQKGCHGCDDGSPQERVPIPPVSGADLCHR